MVTRFQFESVMKLIDAGVTNYIQIRQQVGLTSDQLDDILQNIDYYKKYFAEQERLKTLNRLQRPEKRPWWKR